jgi:hypothetical protein
MEVLGLRSPGVRPGLLEFPAFFRGVDPLSVCVITFLGVASARQLRWINSDQVS